MASLSPSSSSGLSSSESSDRRHRRQHRRREKNDVLRVRKKDRSRRSASAGADLPEIPHLLIPIVVGAPPTVSMRRVLVQRSGKEPIDQSRRRSTEARVVGINIAKRSSKSSSSGKTTVCPRSVTASASCTSPGNDPPTEIFHHLMERLHARNVLPMSTYAISFEIIRTQKKDSNLCYQSTSQRLERLQILHYKQPIGLQG